MNTDSINGIIGTALVAGVAFKALDMMGNLADSNQPRKKKGKRNSSSIFDMDFGNTSKKKSRRNNDDIFGGGFY